ncbi:hypothetical protein NERG_00011 [Nematocida ausubeli]|uniref:Uncharacterized protein n=1 Tax=Nematocida ausubeli (strain ATCC PRA-371 / ERTm2) TaxID=1913371 RepID=H8Z8U1_NEMA1|nr:hypothetical protein NERG_00011 [Nematocida ausubeli]
MICRLLLSLVIMQSILARIDMEDIKKVNKTFVGESQDVAINPKGPLNLLRGYIGHQSGYMHNKRFYSPEIDTDYVMSKKGLSCLGKQEYDFTRTPVNDRVYKDLDTTTPEGNYLSTYHTQLIKMFPSMFGDLSIEIDRSNALTNFLRAEHVKKDTKYILAALLLLSEGVDVKIAVESTKEKKKLVIKSKTCKEKEFVNVVMHTAGLDPVTNEHSENIYQSEAAEIVTFYIRCRDNPLLKRVGEFAMPVTREQFESGLFLNNAAFLIQTYIYEFIDTAEDYKDFVEAAHELMVDQVAEKESPKQTKKKDKNRRIFDKLFIEKEALNENIKYTTSFYNLVKAKSGNLIFPFYNNIQLPRYTRVPRCKLDKSGFELDQSLYYSDCVETVLLGLFCCLAYNLETQKYETSHMGEGVSKELKEFFEKYPKPTETTDFEMHKQWSKVVACLKNNKINYKQSRNELLPEFSNIFLVIAEITGQKKGVLELLEYVESVCKAGKLDINQQCWITVKIDSILKSLSLNKHMKVLCFNMTIGETPSGKADILSDINIIYYGSEITLNVKKGIIDISLASSLYDNSEHIREKFKEVRDMYSDVDCYIGYIVAHYIDAELDLSNNNGSTILKNIGRDINIMLQDESQNLSKIFLHRDISTTHMKSYIMECFVFGALDKKVTPKSPLARFTANILGSTSLVYPETRVKMIPFLAILAGWREFYPKLGFTLSDYPSEHIFAWEVSMGFYEKIISCPVRIAVKATCNYLRASSGCQTQTHHARYFLTSTLLFNYIMSDGELDNLMEIQSVVSKYMSDHELTQIYFCWFVHLCTSKYKFSPESFKKVYSLIYSDHYPHGFYVRIVIETRKEFKKCLSVLKERKALFCSKDDPESMKKYNGLVKYIKEDCLGLVSSPQVHETLYSDQKCVLM